MSKKIIISLLIGLVLTAGSVLARTNATSSGEGRLEKELRGQVQVQFKEARQAIQKAIKEKRDSLQKEAQKQLKNLKDATLEGREKIIEGLKSRREALKEEAQALRQNLRENAKGLRDNFREKVKSVKERARIGAAHGKGLRMLNRFRSAIARFEHILKRLETRTQKLEAQGKDISSITPLIEEAKNTQVQAEAKIEDLKAKYESLLEGGNSKGIGQEAQTMAKEIKAEIEKLHNKLKEIVIVLTKITPQDEEKNEATNAPSQ